MERADTMLWDFLTPRVAAQHTPAIVEPVGDRRSTWWVLAELGRRLGYELADTDGEQATDDARLATISAGARCTIDELAAAGWVEKPYELPAPWAEDHLDRLGGWRLAPQLLVDQLATLGEPAPLVLVPRRQSRHLNSQLDFLGERAEVIVHPEDAAAAGVVDGEPVVVRSARGEIVGVAKVDPSVRAGAVSVPHGHQTANVNTLTDKDEIDLPTGMARYAGVPVSLHPVSSEAATPSGSRAG
jgi:anaerobic selenocysteine-containing dehydrogenase